MSQKRKSQPSIEVPVQDPATDAMLNYLKGDDPAVSPVGTEFEEIDIGDEVTYPDQDMQSGKRVSVATNVTETSVEVIWRDGSRRTFPRHKIEKV